MEYTQELLPTIFLSLVWVHMAIKGFGKFHRKKTLFNPKGSFGEHNKLKKTPNSIADFEIKIHFVTDRKNLHSNIFIYFLLYKRLVHHDDCLDRTLYPLLIKKHWLWTRKCFVCKMYTARWWPTMTVLHRGPMFLLWCLLPNAPLWFRRQQTGGIPRLSLCWSWNL